MAVNDTVRGARRALLLAVAGWLIAPAVSVGAGSKSEAVAIGAPLREATMLGLNGPSRRLSEFRGQPMLINVWASWCGPCREEMASLERLAWHADARHFTVIGISTDDYRDRALAFLRKSNATITHFIDRKLELEHMLGASALPLTVLVSADGRVLARIYGAREWDSPESLQLLARTFGYEDKSRRPPPRAAAGQSQPIARQ